MTRTLSTAQLVAICGRRADAHQRLADRTWWPDWPKRTEHQELADGYRVRAERYRDGLPTLPLRASQAELDFLTQEKIQ